MNLNDNVGVRLFNEGAENLVHIDRVALDALRTLPDLNTAD